MTVICHASPRAFLDRAGPLLYSAEAENNLLLGLAETASRETTAPPHRRWFLTVEQDDRVVGASLLAEPFCNAIITRLPTTAITELIDSLSRESVPVLGAIGPEPYSAEFASLWSRTHSSSATLKFNQRIYQCTAVKPVPSVPGTLREGLPAELDLLLAWNRAFDSEIGFDVPPAHSEDLIRKSVAARSLFVWDHDGPVSIAGVARETANGITVAKVFTPPQFRNRGYATAVVAALTQLQLSRGKRFCTLYTDLANPVSNSIYQKIGYSPLCDSQLWRFETK